MIGARPPRSFHFLLVLATTLPLAGQEPVAGSRLITRVPPDLYCAHAVFSPDGGRVAYWVIQSSPDRQFIVVGEERGKGYADVGLPVFSPDGKHVAYLARAHGSFVVMLDGREIGPFDKVFEMAFARDGSHLAFGAQQADELWWMVAPLP